MHTLDTTFAIPEYSPVCTLCRHWRPEQGRTCTAFPRADSIPLPIWRGEHNHTTPYPGDSGVQFESVPDEEVPGAA